MGERTFGLAATATARVIKAGQPVPGGEQQDEDPREGERDGS